MRLDHIALACVLAVGAWSGCLGRVFAEVKPHEGRDAPERLVQAALETELRGPSDVRKELLARALALDPEFAPAQWQSGFVRWEGQWRTPDAIARHVSADKARIAYRQLRDAMIDTADNHRSLAQWCRKHSLLAESRAHWLKVLEFEPNDAQAHQALDLEWFEGRLLTRGEIKQARQQAKNRQQAIRRFRPTLTAWRTAIEHGSAKQRDEAMSGLRELSDAAAVPALGMSLETNVASKHGLEFQRLLIEALGRMKDSEATSLLLRMALVPDSLELRTAAADQLKKRPMFTYVPQLIAAAPAKMTNRFEVLTREDGQIVCQDQLVFSGKDFDYTVSRNAFFAPIIGLPNPSSLASNAQLHGVAATELVGEQQSDEARAYQRWSEDAKRRIQFVLKRATGFETADDPQLWEQQWESYNGWSSSPYSAEPRKMYWDEGSSYSPNWLAIWMPIFVPVSEPAPEPPPAAPPVQTASSRPLTVSRQSCFPAGTPVQALSGPVAIEKLRCGDRVLAQDPRTGELTYKTVHETTLRPATPLVKLTLGSETIRATLGHPFWVVGTGWRVAKFLKVGDLVHGMNGALVVDAIEPQRPSEVYNLVISDLHNYFVGQQRLLVHDNSPLEESAAGIPGLVAKTVAP